MTYKESKVYYDGSHYIAIPHTESKKHYRPKPPKEEITVVRNKVEGSAVSVATEPFTPCENDDTLRDGQISVCNVTPKTAANTGSTDECKMTKKELFEELYLTYVDLPRKERFIKIMDGMVEYFDCVERAKQYVENGFERKRCNLISRRIRMTRKANLASFNYFCTFTYNDDLHTEHSFKKGLKVCLHNLSNRKKWRYMGVWERSPEKQRLHFHGLFHVLDGAMVGMLFEKTDYSFKTHTMRTTMQNTYFNEKFGRSDFEELSDRDSLGSALAYLMKYIEKTGERIVYSKGLYQYFVADIMDEDVITTVGAEDKKLLLFDDFACWYDGYYMGIVSPEVIARMKGSD